VVQPGVGGAADTITLVTDSRVQRSADGGATWAQRDFAGDEVGEVVGIKFVNPMIGFVVHNKPAGSPLWGECRCFRTINGGYTWELTTLPDNEGVNSLWGCDENLAFVAGNVIDAGTAFVGKVFGA